MNLPGEKVLLMYKAQKNRVIVTADNGQKISIPWARLQPFVTGNGVCGRFQMTFDDSGKCLSLTTL